MVLTELAAKGLQILKDALPLAKQIGALWNPATPSHRVVMKEVGVAAQSLGVQLLMLLIETVADFDGVFEMMAREHTDGFLVPGRRLPTRNVLRWSSLSLSIGSQGFSAIRRTWRQAIS